MRCLAYAVCALFTGAIVFPAAAGVISSDGVVSLTPDERETALNSATGADNLGSATGLRAVHGEVGIEMDSRGGHAVYGTTVMPIGSSGFLALSFLNGQYGRPFRR